ncbi:hypothetical protein HTZ84_20335 [Haloterrigena sp. SYSU A558-1]|uniref:DUF7344 domain-containing protein n=1 Tax=Haloterrigena gelatinilytica TaxID=2741724 RepID=A0A8J8GGL1_9EURY|nr:hypothetical protein [Haloterrigena gelatinilytica]NUB89554.1 hypothetical protein [Haloterrigena gelatinilytica]NUC74615.1 hypothetical protein [Haloterrigena gelatinilytica]
MVVAGSVVDIERLAQVTNCSIEAAATLLGSSRTRIALRVLSRCDPPVSLDRLAADVAAVDDERTRAAVRITLVHATLPKLEDYGLLEYDIRSETVHLSGPVVALEEPLGTLPDGDDRRR